MAEVKKIKVIEITFNREFAPPGKGFTIYYFNLKADDGFNILDGEFSSNGRNQVKFLVNETYDVVVETKSNRGGSYLWFDYSEAEKEKRKANTPSPSGKKGGQYSWVRSRPEALLIISQSSYESAVIACKAIAPTAIQSHKQVADIARLFCKFIVEMSGLASPECKSDNKIALKDANEKSILYQKALKIAVLCLDLPELERNIDENVKPNTTAWMIRITELIVKDLIEIAHGL